METPNNTESNRAKPRRASARVLLSELAEMLDLPTWERIDELNLDHYAECASAACDDGECSKGVDCDAYLEAEMQAQTEVFRAYKGAVLAAVESVFGAHGLAVEPLRIRVRGRSERVESDHDFRVVLAPGQSWLSAATAIRETIEGVGTLGWYEGGTAGFLRSGPYTAREACLKHLHWLKRRADVYGTRSPRTIYEGAWR
jgi:hypothetical protein